MIQIVNVSVDYRSHVTALSDVSLDVEAGEFVFLVGPTGSGKSTLLKLLYGEQKPTQGRVIVAGQDVQKLRPGSIPYFRRHVGVVFQDYGLLPDKTAYENVAFALRVTGAGRREVRKKVPPVLEMVGVAHRPDAFPHQLSGGEQQRIAIARALVNAPSLLLADEPTGNLDPDTSSGIMELLQMINRQGTTLLVATHAESLVDRMQQRVVALHQGCITRDEKHGNYRQPALSSGESDA